MAQLDFISFFSQLFWLFVTFSALYIVIRGIYIPKISFVKKARYKLINYYSQIGSSTISGSNRLSTLIRLVVNKRLRYLFSVVIRPYMDIYTPSYRFHCDKLILKKIFS